MNKVRLLVTSGSKNDRKIVLSFNCEFGIIIISRAGRETLVHISDGRDARLFCRGDMKELSIFVDESGDWGEYRHYSPYYIITFVFHDQSISIAEDLCRLDVNLRNLGYAEQYLHAGPIIRGEERYRNVEIAQRKKILKTMMGFVRRMDVKYKSFFIEKKRFKDSLAAIGGISKQLSLFVREHLSFFFAFDVVKVYYDNGQVEVTKILSSVLNAFLDNVEFKKAIPKDYRLFQVADFMCTMTLVRLKMEQKELSRSEITFFESERVLKKQYLKSISEKELI